EVGHIELAYDYFAEAALMDLHDLEHNTGDGLHIASLAGAAFAAVAGFGGMRDYDGNLSFAPRLPARLERLAFTVVLHDCRVRFAATKPRGTDELRGGASLELSHHGRGIVLARGKPVTEPIRAAERRPTPTQPNGRAPARRGPAES